MTLKKKNKKIVKIIKSYSNPHDISQSVLVLLSSRDELAILAHASKIESITDLSLGIVRCNLPLLSKCSLLQCKSNAALLWEMPSKTMMLIIVYIKNSKSVLDKFG